MILDRLPWKAVAEAVSMTGTGIGPGRWISTADVGVTAAVDSITIADRQLAVPWHGRVAVGLDGPGIAQSGGPRRTRAPVGLGPAPGSRSIASCC